MIRAKFEVTAIKSHSFSETTKTVTLSARYDDTIPEDRRFQEATPYGEMEIQISNPAALEHLTLGRSFYLDFVPTAG